MLPEVERLFWLVSLNNPINERSTHLFVNGTIWSCNERWKWLYYVTSEKEFLCCSPDKSSGNSRWPGPGVGVLVLLRFVSWACSTTVLRLLCKCHFTGCSVEFCRHKCRPSLCPVCLLWVTKRGASAVVLVKSACSRKWIRGVTTYEVLYCS